MDEMLLQISQLDFCLADVTLFLDTHPENQEALRYYNEACCHLNRLKHDFIKNGGALSNRQCANIDNYINEPFPWTRRLESCGAMKNACNFQ